MVHPKIVTSAYLSTLAKPDEKYMVRLILTVAASNKQYRVNGRRQTVYVFEFDPELATHKLDIPESVYMDGIPKRGVLRDKGELMAYDIFAKRSPLASNIVPLILPWSGYVAPPVETPVVRDISESPEVPGGSRVHHHKVADDSPLPQNEKTRSEAAVRSAEYRAKKAAEKQAALAATE
jgi:hypothetical protein